MPQVDLAQVTHEIGPQNHVLTIVPFAGNRATRRKVPNSVQGPEVRGRCTTRNELLAYIAISIVKASCMVYRWK